MKKFVLICFLLFSTMLSGKPTDSSLPAGFVDLEIRLPGIQKDLRYLSNRNFLGTRVDGYIVSRLILSFPAAVALEKVSADLAPYGFRLKVFDAYRPQRAVDHFVDWAEDLADTLMKAQYYPNVAKTDLFEKGYIAWHSSHSRGSTIDLTLVSLNAAGEWQELDMGTGFDWFGVESWPDNPHMTATQRANRLLLHELMLKHGFKSYSREWWHFTLRDEPFPETYFDFLVQ